MDTWYYLTTDQDYDRETIPMEYVWERLRNKRDNLLNATDYRMVSDAPWDRSPWEIYREALRNLPKNTVDPRLAEWPVSPNE